MTELGAQVQEALGQALLAVVPLVLAALGGSVVAGWLAVRAGLQDPVAAGVLRGLAVLGALTVVADGMVVQAQSLTAEAWSQLSAVGRAEP